MSLERSEELSSVIDYDALLTRCLNNLEFAERILNLFQGRCGEELSELERALDVDDMESVGRIAHRLAGACANAAASQMQARAADLRHAVNDGSRDKASQCLGELKKEWRRFTAAMPAEHGTPSATLA